MKKQAKKIRLIVQNGQYEQSAVSITVTCATWRGFCRRATQLQNEYAVYGDNFAGWITGDVAIAHKNDEWHKNTIIGGRSCEPVNGWLREAEIDGPLQCTYDMARSLLGL